MYFMIIGIKCEYFVSGLPTEAYSIYEEYPWRFGYVFCIIKALFAEMTSYASVLTITAFTVERYIAICHPLKAHKIATYSRCIKIIISIWLISLVCALPYPIHTDLFYYVHDDNKAPVVDSLICNIPNQYHERMMHVFQLSFFIFFVFPLTVLIVLYSLIGLSLRKAELRRAASDECHHRNYSHRHSGNASPSDFRQRVSSHSGHTDGSPSTMHRKVVLKLLGKYRLHARIQRGGWSRGSKPHLENHKQMRFLIKIKIKRFSSI